MPASFGLAMSKSAARSFATAFATLASTGLYSVGPLPLVLIPGFTGLAFDFLESLKFPDSMSELPLAIPFCKGVIIVCIEHVRRRGFHFSIAQLMMHRMDGKFPFGSLKCFLQSGGFCASRKQPRIAFEIQDNLKKV
jgi:hypothetical protein